ncbi:MAG: hypothetical protein ACE5H4_09460 [Candidatus Thorarchaeota archaeon]
MLAKSFWLKMAAKVVVVMSLPMAVMFGTGDFGPTWYYRSPLFTIGNVPGPMLPMPYPEFQWPNILMLAAILAVCAPGIYFSYWLDGQHGETSIRKHLLAAMIFTPMVAYMASIVVGGFPTDPWVGFYAPSSVEYSTIWVLVVLILLPVFTREGALLQAARHRKDSESERLVQSSSLLNSPSRGLVLGLSIGVVALFFPLFGHTFGPGFGGASFYLVSPSWMGFFSMWSDGMSVNSSFSLAPIPISLSPMFGAFFLLWPLLCIFNLLFGHSVLRYLQSRISKTRVFLYGVLGAFVPLVVYMLPYLLSPSAVFFMEQTVFPIPILQVLGLLIMFRESPAARDERIWDVSDDRMWFDEDGEKSAPHVKIPFSYLLRSKISGLRNRSKQGVQDSDPHKAEWAREQDVWCNDSLRNGMTTASDSS